MAKKKLELLLRKNVENLGIVGDIVRVRQGYARNYLRPLGLAEPPTPKRIESLQADRAKALAELKALRQAREEVLARMHEVTIQLVRSCNDQGVLYGSVSQRDIADVLQEKGYGVDVRSVRIATAIRRVGTYPVPIQFDKDLRTEVTLIVEPDHPLEEMRTTAAETPEAAQAPEPMAEYEDEAPPRESRGGRKGRHRSEE